MKVKQLVFVVIIFLLTACQTNLKTPSNLVTLSITAIEEKIANQESFTFYFSSGTCSFCLENKNNAIRYLNQNSERTLYRVEINTIPSAKISQYALLIFDLIGEDFYTANGYLANNLYLPSTIRYESGMAVRANIGVIETEDFASWLLFEVA